MAGVSLKRYKQIGEVLIKYGFGYYAGELFPGLNFTSKRKRKQQEEEYSDYSAYARIRMVMEELGPTFVKFGQLMSTRSELFPPELIEELTKLQDRVGVVPFEEIIPTFDKYIPDWRDLFTSIDPNPLAAASIAQVYRGVTRDGTVLAMKVQRPNIRERIEQDLVLIHKIAVLLEEKKPELRMYNPVSLVDDFGVQVRKELDFTRDGSNAERLGRNMRESGIPRIKVPKIYWEYSGRELLAMEFVEGCRGDDIDTMLAQGIDPTELASIGLRAFMVQIFQNGFYHGDPHAGNIRVSPNGELIFLDFGVCGILMKEMRNKFISLLLAILSADTNMTLRSIRNLGVKLPPEAIEEFKGELYLALTDFKELGTNGNFSGLLTTIQTLFQTYNIRIPPNIMQLLKALLLVSNVAFTLDPNLSFVDEVEPYLKKLIKDDVTNHQNMQQRAMELKGKFEDLLAVPKKLAGVLDMASEGKLKVDIAAKELGKLSVSISSSMDKAIIGLILSSIIIGISLVVMNQQFDMGAIPVILYICAVLVILILFFTMRARIKKQKKEY